MQPYYHSMKLQRCFYAAEENDILAANPKNGGGIPNREESSFTHTGEGGTFLKLCGLCSQVCAGPRTSAGPWPGVVGDLCCKPSWLLTYCRYCQHSSCPFLCKAWVPFSCWQHELDIVQDYQAISWHLEMWIQKYSIIIKLFGIYLIYRPTSFQHMWVTRLAKYTIGRIQEVSQAFCTGIVLWRDTVIWPLNSFITALGPGLNPNLHNPSSIYYPKASYPLKIVNHTRVAHWYNGDLVRQRLCEFTWFKWTYSNNDSLSECKLLLE